MIRQIRLTHFRRFSSLTLTFSCPVVILSGANATGKTTVLEAIYLIATSKSHRTNDLSSLIEENQPIAHIEIKNEASYRIDLQKKGKISSINDQVIPKVSDFIGRLPVVLFAPEDLKLIEGMKSDRRRFMDLELSLLDKKYLRSSMLYKKILKERNERLKQDISANDPLLKVLTDQLIEQIRILYPKRCEWIEELNGYLKQICQELHCEEIKLVYQSSFDFKHLNQSFFEKLKSDLWLKNTGIGLHRDDFNIVLDEKDAFLFASEGQKRTIVLCLKLALKEVIEHRLNTKPILLLDDVFAALDQKRIQHIMNYMIHQNQTLITTTSLFNIPDALLKEAQIIRFERG